MMALHMPHEIRVPRLGWSMETGTFLGWHKRDGDPVRIGEILYELEGDKAVQEIESLDAGVLRIPPQAPTAGTTVAVGALLGYLAAPGEALPAWGESPSVATDAEKRPTTASSSDTQTPSPAILREKNVVHASPRARRVAAETGVDWTGLRGSGRGGRVRERDVRAAAGAANAGSGGQPLSGRRRTIAERLRHSFQQSVPVTLTTRADATSLVDLRSRLKAASGEGPVPTYLDLFVKLVAEMLAEYPRPASRWDGDRLVPPNPEALHIGIAVDTDDGLLVPVIRDAGRLPLARIARRSRELIERARAGELTSEEQTGGVFTITNLGAFGIDAFTPIINHPETAILGLGAIRREPAVLPDGQIAPRDRIALSLTFDHRALDGAPAARFLQALVLALESQLSDSYL